VVLIAAIAAGVIGIALWLWMASANGKGKKWARIVATVFAAINVLSFVYALTTDTSPTLSLLVGAASVLVGIAALVFMYRSDATQFYNANSAR
jgi:FtsH-binding integral membrane protein